MIIVVLCLSMFVLGGVSLLDSFICSCLVDSWIGVSGFLILCVSCCVILFYVIECCVEIMLEMLLNMIM